MNLQNLPLSSNVVTVILGWALGLFFWEIVGGRGVLGTYLISTVRNLRYRVMEQFLVHAATSLCTATETALLRFVTAHLQGALSIPVNPELKTVSPKAIINKILGA